MFSLQYVFNRRILTQNPRIIKFCTKIHLKITKNYDIILKKNKENNGNGF